MALTETRLANKRTRKVLRRRALRNGRRRNYASLEVGIERARAKIDILAIEKRQEALEAARKASKQAVQDAVKGRTGGFVKGSSKKLFDLVQRRTGGGE